MKEALKKIAYSEHRTACNKAFMILQQWIEDHEERDEFSL